MYKCSDMRKNIATIQEKDVVLWVNIALIGMATLLFFYYVMTANSIASKSYRTQVLMDKVEVLSEANSLLMSQKLTLDTPDKISEFAQSQQLVEAKNISYIFEKKNVALQR